MAVTLILSVPAPARAESSLEGRWRQSGLREDFTIQQWIDARCGAPPRSTTQGGGEIVTVRMEGDELTFLGGGRVYRTNQCYDPMPTLAREAHSRDPNGKSWRTQCRTPPNDPRKAVLNTLVMVTTDTRIDLVETGRYEVTTEGGRCIADVKRTRSFERVREEPAPAATPAAAPKPDTKATCASPGPPARLEVRPSKKLLRTGDTFAFRALVLDANGCDTRTPTRWRLAPELDGTGIQIDAKGTVTVASDAPEATVEIVVTAAGKDARVVVEVASPARYDELLARSGLNALGESEEAAIAMIASQSLGAGEGHVEDRSRQRRLVFVGIIGALLLALGAAALVVTRRARRAKALLERAEERHQARLLEVLDRRRRVEEEHAAQMKAHLESVEAARLASEQTTSRATCGACGREFSDDTSFCPHDGTRLEPRIAAPAAAPAPASFCPVCRKSFGLEVRVCPFDKAELLPLSAAGPHPRTPRGKICPRCGDRFEGGAQYCGKDGTQLVLIN